MEDVNRYAKTGWGQKANQTFDAELPSGQMIELKKLGMREIVKTGLVAQLDTFTAQLIPNGTGNPEVDSSRVVLEALKDSSKFDQLEATIDKIILICVLQPKVLSVPPEGHQRNSDAVYVDEIDLDDKMFIFSAVFEGAGDMSRFREGQGGDMVPVETEPATPDATQPDGGVSAGVS